MGEFSSDIKRKKVLKGLNKLSYVGDFEVVCGGKHQWLVKHSSWKRPFPIPFKHNTVSKYILNDLLKKVVETGEIDKDEFKNIML